MCLSKNNNSATKNWIYIYLTPTTWDCAKFSNDLRKNNERNPIDHLYISLQYHCALLATVKLENKETFFNEQIKLVKPVFIYYVALSTYEFSLYVSLFTKKLVTLFWLVTVSTQLTQPTHTNRLQLCFAAFWTKTKKNE